jgi:DNA repair exonuclease SbcCD ATPase subunit
MATEKSHSQEFDLDRTDKLPILKGVMFDAEVADDATPMSAADARSHFAEDTVLTPVPAESAALNMASSGHPDFLRPSPVDLPSLAESMRTVEERIARQQAEYDSLSRNYERSRESEAAALTRLAALERDAALLRATLESEQARVKEHERALAERQAANESARSRAEAAQLDAQRHLSEASTLKESLTSRDATIVEVLHSLGERDAQLAALQQEHAKARQSLDEDSRSQAKLAEDVSSAHAKITDLAKQLAASVDAAALLSTRAKRAETEVNQLRAELGSVRATSSSYLEQLRTREFRRGFDENLFRELDARVGAADAGQNSLLSERDRLQTAAAARELKMTDQTAALEKSKADIAAHLATTAQQARDLKLSEAARDDLKQQFATADAERARLSSDLKARDAALAEARAAASGDVQRITQRLGAAEQRQAEQSDQILQMQSAHAAKVVQVQSEHVGAISQLQSEHATQLAALQTQQQASLAELVAQAEEREQEMTVLMAHLHEARKPMEPLEAEIKRLAAELSAKAQAFDDINAEVQQLRSMLERTRGALEEREFLIRRLERAESNNANVLGRIQTSMERLGSGALIVDAAIPPGLPEWSAELVRVDGDRNISHTLSRRTRIGRASGCELQVDSTSVSRHHALVVAGPRETIIEDLNSTNGVIVNGRKISRAFLNDGDVVIVGDVHFRFAAKSTGSGPATLEAPVTG